MCVCRYLTIKQFVYNICTYNLTHDILMKMKYNCNELHCNVLENQTQNQTQNQPDFLIGKQTTIIV